ncbi:unnamed protein product [Linum trigynum]|uniref:Uncharacterized protein n=1 Tax=Linum trigynum TaxID=586398 RepID=A0AAV2GSG2_9ROSI
MQEMLLQGTGPLESETMNRTQHLQKLKVTLRVYQALGSRPGSLSFILYLDSKMKHSSHVEGQNQIVLGGSCMRNPKGIQFTAMLELQIGGTAVISLLESRKLKVDGADRALLVLVASSSSEGAFH